MKLWSLPILAFLSPLLLLAQNTDNNQDRCGFGIVPEIRQPTCPGDSDGRIVINSTVPVATLSYRWLNLPVPITSNAIGNLSKGVYTVIVSNNICADTLRIPIGLPDIEARRLDTAFCGISGRLDLLQNIKGGNGEFRVTAVRSLFGTPLDCVTCTANEVEIDKTSYFTVQVRDRNGCPATRDVFVELLDSLKNRIEIKDETCTENGRITLITTGGSGNYRYRLNNSNLLQTEPVFRGLRGNQDYIIQVEDVKGCRVTEIARVRNTPQFTPATLAVQDVTCNGARDGSIQVRAASTATITGYALNALTAAPQQQPRFERLPPGDYKVFVLEGSDCYVAYPARINEPDLLTVETAVQDPNCPGQPGSAEFRAGGGNGGYTFAVNDRPFQARNIFENLPAGNYRITVRDRLGCQTRDVFTVSEPEQPPLGAQVTASCPGDSSGAIVIVEGGKLLLGNYRFSLDSLTWQERNLFDGLPAGRYNVFVWYPNGCIYKVEVVIPSVAAPEVFFRIQNVSCPGGTDGAIVVEFTRGRREDYRYSLDGTNYTERNSFKDLAAGDYRLFLRDSLRCVFGYTFSIKEPDTPLITTQQQAVSCPGSADGRLLVQARGSASPFEYALNSGDFNRTGAFANLPAGVHIMLVRDANGCLFTQEVSIAEPPRLEIQFTTIDETCGNKNGVLGALPLGGTPPYRFLWNTRDTTPVIARLRAGSYTLTVTDRLNCKRSETTSIKNVSGPVVLGEITNVPCYGTTGGAIALTVIGGSEPFLYRWSNGQRSKNIWDIPAGSYTVTVTDTYECQSIKTFNLLEPAPLKLETQTGESNGLWFINLIVEGGAPPYRYRWSSGETTEDVFNLKPGAYTVTVTDQSNCSRELTVNVGTTSAGEPSWAAYVNVFPNPTADWLNIVVDAPAAAPQTLTLFNAIGQVVRPPQTFSDKQIRINLAELPAGVYWLRLEREKAWLHHKVIRR